MTNTLLKLQRTIPEPLCNILETISSITDARGYDTFVIGATARDLILDYGAGKRPERTTTDVDFGIAVKDWTEYQDLKTSLISTGEFTPHPKQEQAVWFNRQQFKIKVDLVPFGGLESEDSMIAFPPDGDFVMSTVGFLEAFGSALNHDLASGRAIRIASLAGIVLLKFIAYSDRSRDRDVQDIWFITQNYLLDDNESRLYGDESDLLDDPDFDMKTIGARLLGRDLAVILNPKSHRIVSSVLTAENEGGRLEQFADVIYRDGLRDDERYDQILHTLGQIKNGLIERYKQSQDE